MNRSGSWWLSSKIGPRWNRSGRSDFMGGCEAPEECNMEIERLKLKYGEQPEDLTWGYMKD